MLPPPPEDFEFPEPTQAEFEDLDAPEDEALLATGAWDNEPDDEPEVEVKSKRPVHIHVHR